MISFFLKALVFYASLEAISCLAVALLFRIPLNNMLWLYFLFFLPALLSLPFLLGARQFRHKPKVYVSLLAIGISLFAALTSLAMYFSGAFNGMFPAGFSRGELVFVVILVVAVAAVQSYRIAQKSACTANK